MNEATSPTGSVFDYFKVISESAIWPLIAIGVLIWLFYNKELLGRIAKLKVGNFEIELEKLQAQINENQEKIEALENDLSREARAFHELLNEVDTRASVAKLESVRKEIKNRSRILDDLQVIRQSLREESSPEEIYAASVALRERPTPKLLPEAVSRLDQLARDSKLGRVRLHFVWNLTSAIHRILMVAAKLDVADQPSTAELERARDVLQRLNQHPLVQLDRPDAPSRGVRGPIKHGLTWIGRMLERR